MTSFRLQSNYSFTAARPASSVTSRYGDTLFQFVLEKLGTLLSLATPTYTVAQIAERFEPNTVSWTLHTIQPSCSVL